MLNLAIPNSCEILLNGSATKARILLVTLFFFA